MDYYDSTYPLDYYKIGEKYIFYRDTTNRNYWVPQSDEEQHILDTYISKCLNEAKSDLNTSAKKNTQGVTEVKGSSTPGVTEAFGYVGKKGITEDKNSITKKTSIALDEEGEIINYPGINKEIGIVIAKYDNPKYKLLTVVFDDGKVLDYAIGVSSFFNQKNYKVKGPKLKVVVPPLDKKQMPLCLQKMINSDELFTGHDAEILGISKKSSMEKGITEISKATANIGVTETGELKEKVGITEIE